MRDQLATDIPDDVRPYLDTIADRLLSGHAAVMVGAGFSRNAVPPGDDTAFPTWSQLGDRFYERLHGHKPPRNHHYIQVPTLAHEIEAAFGRPALDQMLRDAIPDLQHEPSQLHIKLLDLPWSDVFTTNYDTLLERASRTIISQRYDIIVRPVDLGHSKRPRIIKLHGSLPSERPFIVTDEDYRRYPHDFAPFVNTVRQALLENTLCLIGFSGDDPNFLQWIGWIHDNLGSASSPKMYLIGSLRPSQSQKVLLERRNIIPVDMSQYSGAGGNHYTALELFVEYLRSRRAAYNPLDWPTSGSNDPSPSNTADFATLVATWRSQRCTYPGWVILPENRRLTLWLRTQRWTRDLPPTESLPGTLSLQFAFELAWRMEKCLCPLFDDQAKFIQLAMDRHWPPTAPSVFRDDQPAAGIDSSVHRSTTDNVPQICHYLLLTLLRHYREEGLSNEWKKAQRRLQDSADQLSAEHTARLHYERALFALFSMDLQELKARLAEWPPHDAQPFWAARKAGLLAEIGRVDEAQQVLEQSLNGIRAKLNLAPTRANYALVSQESFVMFVLHAIRHRFSPSAASETATQIQRREFRERWHALRQYNCDPWHDVELFEHLLDRPRVTKSPMTEAPTFDIGGMVHTSSWGNWDQEALTAYSFLRYSEDAGIPFQVPGCALTKKTAAGTLARIAPYSSHWAVATLLRIADQKMVDEIFDRASLARLDTIDVDGLADRYVEALRSATPEIEKVRLRGDQNFAGLLAEVVPEILSRLSAKCSPDVRERLVDLLLEIYSSEHRWKYRGIRNLTVRLLKATPAEQQLALLPKLLQFPILDALDPLAKQEFANPFDFVDLSQYGTVEKPEVADETLDPFFAKALSEDDSVRTWAISTLGQLHDLELLADTRLSQFGEVLWAKRRDDGMPSGTSYYRHAFLTLPHPADVDPTALFMEYVRSARFPAQESRTSTQLPIGGSSVIALCREIQAAKSIPWSAEDVRGLVERLVAWWDIDKEHLHKADLPSPLASLAGDLRERMSQLVDTLTMIVERHADLMGAETTHRPLRRVVEECHAYEVPALRLELAGVRLFPDWRDGVLQRLEVAMASPTVRVVVDALYGMDLMSQRHRADSTPKHVAGLLRIASQMISWQRDAEAWAATIDMVGSVVKRHPRLLAGEVERWVLLGLGRVSAQTAIRKTASGKVSARGPQLDVMAKLLVRRAAARLAFALFARYRARLDGVPEPIGEWEKACLSDDEFAEVRNQWKRRNVGETEQGSGPGAVE